MRTAKKFHVSGCHRKAGDVCCLRCLLYDYCYHWCYSVIINTFTIVVVITAWGIIFFILQPASPEADCVYFCENFHRLLPPPSKTIHRDRRNIFTIQEALSIEPWVNKLTAGLLRKYCKPNWTNTSNFPFHPSFLSYFDHLLNCLGTIFKSTNGKKKVEGRCKLIETPNATDEKHKRCFWHIAVRK